ncbi:MAG: hypothetical protein P9C48_13235 [Defluviicoccus sp.]|nr:hypothetical protein [Defluviicoccus sp.]MDG4610083.1 hypothetical protein [Defluviicoccus sp.]
MRLSTPPPEWQGLSGPLRSVEQAGDPGQRDAEPVRAVGGFVADLVQRLFEHERIDRSGEGGIVLRYRETAFDRRAIGGEEARGCGRSPPGDRRALKGGTFAARLAIWAVLASYRSHPQVPAQTPYLAEVLT